MVNASPDVEVTSHVPSLIEARQALMAREAYGVLLIPENMERDLLLGRRPELVVLANNQFLTTGGIVTRAVGGALRGFTAEVAQQVRIVQGQTQIWLPLLSTRTNTAKSVCSTQPSTMCSSFCHP